MEESTAYLSQFAVSVGRISLLEVTVKLPSNIQITTIMAVTAPAAVLWII